MNKNKLAVEQEDTLIGLKVELEALGQEVTVELDQTEDMSALILPLAGALSARLYFWLYGTSFRVPEYRLRMEPIGFSSVNPPPSRHYSTVGRSARQLSYLVRGVLRGDGGWLEKATTQAGIDSGRAKHSQLGVEVFTAGVAGRGFDGWTRDQPLLQVTSADVVEATLSGPSTQFKIIGVVRLEDWGTPAPPRWDARLYEKSTVAPTSAGTWLDIGSFPTADDARAHIERVLHALNGGR
jgi:hypothetical protein